MTSGSCSWPRQTQGFTRDASGSLLGTAAPATPGHVGKESRERTGVFGGYFLSSLWSEKLMANSSLILILLRSSLDLSYKFWEALSSNPGQMKLGANDLVQASYLTGEDPNPEKFYHVFSRSHFELGKETCIYFWSWRMLQISFKESKPDSKNVP